MIQPVESFTGHTTAPEAFLFDPASQRFFASVEPRGAGFEPPLAVWWLEVFRRGANGRGGRQIVRHWVIEAAS